MKFYSRVLGGRDYSLLETVHFGLRLPATVSSFGNVRSVSISDWSVVKRGPAMAHTRRDERATFRNKREIFDVRGELERPHTIELQDLKHLSVYAFWRLYDINKNRLVKKQREQFLALSGPGWAARTKKSHTQHSEYAKRTLLAYMPCPGLAGTNYMVDVVAPQCDNKWEKALEDFVTDQMNRWCPTWIRRNYEVQNEILHGFPQLSLPATPGKEDASGADGDNDRPRLPHAAKFNEKFEFERGGEATAENENEADEPNPYIWTLTITGHSRTDRRGNNTARSVRT